MFKIGDKIISKKTKRVYTVTYSYNGMIKVLSDNNLLWCLPMPDILFDLVSDKKIKRNLPEWF